MIPYTDTFNNKQNNLINWSTELTNHFVGQQYTLYLHTTTDMYIYMCVWVYIYIIYMCMGIYILYLHIHCILNNSIRILSVYCMCIHTLATATAYLRPVSSRHLWSWQRYHGPMQLTIRDLQVSPTHTLWLLAANGGYSKRVANISTIGYWMILKYPNFKQNHIKPSSL